MHIRLSDQEKLLIQLLADGIVHSGQALCQATGTTRTHIWKLLHKIQNLGIPIASKKGQGYWIDGGLDLLDHTQVLNYLLHTPQHTQWSTANLEIFPLIESTNRYLLQKIKERSSSNFEHPLSSVCLAEGQTQGRGRRGQTWFSPFAQNIYFSLYRCMDNNLASLTGLPLMAAVVMRDVLMNLGYHDIQLKWPNDIYAGDKKLGGILVELVSDAVGPCHVVIGIGLNVHMQRMPIEVAHTLQQPWNSLALLSQENNSSCPSRNHIVAQMIFRLSEALNVFEQQGFQPFLAQWREADYLYGHNVTLTTQNEVVQGQALGISDDGAMRVNVNGTVHTYRGAVVQIRKTERILNFP